jgi:hypothetical protein
LGFLENFERGLERLVNGAFTKTFKSELQPVEIAAAIKNEMDAKSSILSRDRILAPNSFQVRLSSPDFRRMSALGQTLVSELNDLATKHARKQNLQFGAALSIRLVEDATLPIGRVTVGSTTENIKVEWQPTLEINGERYEITKARTTVGRDESADIQINDPGLSRKHFEIVWDGTRGGVRDLQSTNGTRVDGRNISETGIAADAVISAGQSRFIFRVLAKSVAQ